MSVCALKTVSTFSGEDQLVYLGLAAKYWFKVPFVGIAIAATCFLGVVLAKIT